jgi:hypothetical protein
MGDVPDLGVFYSVLAPWWPLISPVEDYAEEGAYIAEVLHGWRTGRHSYRAVNRA